MTWISRLRRRWRLLLVLGFAGAFALVNIAAWQQARAMTTFRPAGERTGRPETLSVLEKIGVMFSGVTLPKPLNGRTPAVLSLSFTTQQITGYSSLALEVWEIPHPQSKGVVVLFHGYGAAKTSLLEPAAAFHQMGFTTVLVDFYGSGGSAGNSTSIGYHEAVDVARVTAWVREQHPGQPVILYGNSMGAAAILRAIAVRHVSVEGAVVECPFDRLSQTARHRFEAMHLPSFPFAPLLLFWGGIQQGFNPFAHNPVEYATQVKCPVLFLHGEEDQRVKVAEAKDIYDHLAGPKQFVGFPGLGHQSYLAAQPDRWHEAVEAFLAQNFTLHQTGTR